jgi:hypothetical protein
VSKRETPHTKRENFKSRGSFDPALAHRPRRSWSKASGRYNAAKYILLGERLCALRRAKNRNIGTAAVSVQLEPSGARAGVRVLADVTRHCEFFSGRASAEGVLIFPELIQIDLQFPARGSVDFAGPDRTSKFASVTAAWKA